MIITGTGSHSAAGPVLRTAVASLLTRRAMEFTRPTPGAFCVNASSGHVWYSTDAQHSAVDTKVIVVASHDDDDDAKWAHVQRTMAAQRRRRKVVSPLHGTSHSSLQNVDVEQGPSVAEVAHDEANLQRAVECSREEARHAAQQRRAEARALKRALAESVVVVQQDNDDDDDLLQQAMEMSQHEHAREQEQFQDELQRALQESSQIMTSDKDSHRLVLTEEEWEALTQQALALSIQETAVENEEHEHGGGDDEARILEEMLRRSLHDTVGP